MFQSFRSAMTWIHTWFGLVLGFVLMGAFFFGALCVFDREIDKWAIPEARFEVQPMPSFDRVLLPEFEAMSPSLETMQIWGIVADNRSSLIDLVSIHETSAQGDARTERVVKMLDPRTGKVTNGDHFKIGSEFFYPLHYSLTLDWQGLGEWIVAFSGMMMLAALISGIVIHRKLFREFFTFRPGKGFRRSTLDLHNLTGVVALPFHFFFAFTGVLIFVGQYFPIGTTQLAQLHELHEQLEIGESKIPTERSGHAAPLASVDAMMAEARRRWAAHGMPGEVGVIHLRFVGDANAHVAIYPAATNSLQDLLNGVHFNGATGAVLQVDPAPNAVQQVAGFLTGLHLQPFRHWPLRWLYALGGLAGCVCIATGLLFFVEKRKHQHAKQGSQAIHVVDALAVTTVTGMVIATLGILIVNRLLPDTLPAGWPRHDDLERYAFWFAWLLAMAHAFWRTAPVAQGRMAPAWVEQCWTITVMSVTAVLLNWITTGDHLLRTLSDTYWPVAGLDLALLTVAAIAALAGRKIKRRAENASMIAESVAQDAARA